MADSKSLKKAVIQATIAAEEAAVLAMILASEVSRMPATGARDASLGEAARPREGGTYLTQPVFNWAAKGKRIEVE